MNSCLYECKTYHSRLAPKKHHFSYRYYIFFLDLDELDLINKNCKLFGIEKYNFFSFRESDHNLKNQKTIKDSISLQLKEQDPSIQVEKIYLLTMTRLLGHVFNPVSFYFIETNLGRRLIAEVMNTFYEFKNFSLKEDATPNRFEAIQDKNFYISPFSVPIGKIKFLVDWPQDNLNILIQNIHTGETTVSANLIGKRKELSDLNLFIMFFKYPLVTIKVFAAIHYQALLLYLKKIPYTKKDQFSQFQTETDLWKIQKK